MVDVLSVDDGTTFTNGAMAPHVLDTYDHIRKRVHRGQRWSSAKPHATIDAAPSQAKHATWGLAAIR